LFAARDHFELLARGWKPTRAAPVATLLDLAARGHLQLVAEPGGQLVCRVPSLGPSDTLTAFENQVREQVTSRLYGDFSPAAALLPDPEDEDGKRWYASFTSAVIDEARRLDLVRDRLSRPVRWGLRAAVVLPAAALGWWVFSLSSSHQLPRLASTLTEWGIGLFFYGSTALALVALLLLPLPVSTMRGSLRGTVAGCAAASRWLGVRAALATASQPPQLPESRASVEDRMVAWAVALNAAPDVVTTLAPARDAGVWTSTGGRWRQVRVSSRPKGLTLTRWPTGCSTVTGRPSLMHNQTGVLGALFGTALAVWVLLFLVEVRTSNPWPSPGLARLALGPEPPAIANLLVQGWKPNRSGWRPSRAAAYATLLDLAARGHFVVVIGPSREPLLQAPRAISEDLLVSFEMQLHEHVAGRLSDGEMPPGAAMPDPEDEDGKDWYKRFELAVIDGARRLGLVGDRFSEAARWRVRVATALPTAALGLWVFTVSSSGPLLVFVVEMCLFWSVFGFALAGLGFLVAGSVLDGVSGTNEGRVAASRWLGTREALLTAPWLLRFPEPAEPLGDRTMAWAVGLDAAPDVLAALAPPDKDHAWSRTRGRWRIVRIPASVRGSVQFPRRRPVSTLTGSVVRRWRKPARLAPYAPEREVPYNYFIAIDDRHRDEAFVWRIPSSEYDRFRPGTDVQVTVDDEGRLIRMIEAMPVGPKQ
jgi:hypothetical protein